MSHLTWLKGAASTNSRLVMMSVLIKRYVRVVGVTLMMVLRFRYDSQRCGSVVQLSLRSVYLPVYHEGLTFKTAPETEPVYIRARVKSGRKPSRYLN